VRRSRASVPGLQETATSFGTSDAASSFGLSRRPRPRWVEHDGVIGRELLGPERKAEQVAVKSPNRLELRRAARDLGESSKRSPIGFEGINRWGPRQGKGEGAKPGKKIRHTFGSSYSIAHKAGHHCFGLARGLQEGAGRKLHLRAERSTSGAVLVVMLFATTVRCATPSAGACLAKRP
jgi:hypothetical protein